MEEQPAGPAPKAEDAPPPPAPDPVDAPPRRAPEAVDGSPRPAPEAEDAPPPPAPDAEDAPPPPAPYVEQAQALPDAGAEQAQRLVRRSWLMLPLVLVSLLAAILFALLMSAITDVDPIDPLRDQGFAGWAVFIVSNLVLWPLPSYFGVWFAVRAARLGSPRATTPLIANGFVIAVVWSLSLLAILGEL